MADLTTEFKDYLIALKTAAPTAQDVTTLVAKDLPVVRAAVPTELDDLNTLYLVHLS